jgi:hypothetical protein
MRAVVLSTQKGGISRLREKGGASPETLMMLRNAYVTTAKTIKQRPGFPVDLDLTPGTVGLASFEGRFYVFASTFVAHADPRVETIVLKHPTLPALELVKVHFSQPFLGRFYVAAEFSNGDVKHYWVTNAPEWSANTVYGYQQQIVPTTPNGFVYVASNVDGTQAWSPNQTVTIGTIRQPTVYSGFKFQVTAVTGTPPIQTSDIEPVWPTAEGATIIEYTYGGTAPPTTPPPPTPTFPPDVGGEYGPFPPEQDPRLGPRQVQ